MTYDLIIGTLALAQIRARIDMYIRTIHERKDRKAEMLHLVYEPELFDATDDELTRGIEKETDAGKVLEKDDFSGLVLTLDATKEGRNETEGTELVRH